VTDRTILKNLLFLILGIVQQSDANLRENKNPMTVPFRLSVPTGDISRMTIRQTVHAVQHRFLLSAQNRYL